MLQINVVFEELMVIFFCCVRSWVPVSITFRLSSTRVIQAIIHVYCCPDQEAGEVQPVTTGWDGAISEFSVFIPRVSVRDFPARVLD